MKQTRFWLVIIAVLLCSISARAHDFEVDGIRYDITSFTDLTVRATSISDVLTGELVVPSKVQFNGKELSVIEVGDDFANSNLSISSLAVNEGVISIGTRAFRDCANLKTIDIAHTVTQIGTECFYGCTSLEAFDNRGIVSLGSKSFAECGNLKVISMENLTSLTEGTFLNCTELSDCNIPNITSIGSEAFKNCQSLKEYSITGNVSSVGKSAFEGCTSLVSMILPNNVKNLGQGIFRDCTALTSISIGAGISYLPWIFEGCTSLSDIRIEDSSSSLRFGYTGNRNHSGGGSIEYTKHHYKPYPAMFTGFNLKNVYIGRNITTEIFCYQSTSYSRKYYYIPNPPFSSSSVASLTIGPNAYNFNMTEFPQQEGVVYVEGTWEGAFQNCTNLDSVTIYSKVTNIPEKAFSGCRKIRFIDIPNSITIIGSNSFEGCTGLKKISLGCNLTTIGENAFTGCDSLEQINLKASIPPTYGTGFSSKNYMNTQINIPTGYLKAYQEADPWKNFWNVSEKNELISTFEVDGTKYSVLQDNQVEIVGNSISDTTELHIKSKVEYYDNCYDVVSISDDAFSGCSYLLSVQIEDGIKDIGVSAFINCTNLKTINMPTGLQTIGGMAFMGCSSLSEILLPTSITSISFSCFRACEKLTSIFLPTNITTIEQYAFSGCVGLTELIIPSGVTAIEQYAFYGCSGLTELTIPSSVTTIDGTALSGCSGLKELVFEDSDIPLVFPNGEYDTATDILKKYVNGESVRYQIKYYKSPFSKYPIEKLYIGRNLSDKSRYNINGDGGMDPYVITSYDAPFCDLPNLKELVIGENVTVLGPNQDYISEVDLKITPGSFKNCSTIRTVEVKSPTPPTGVEFTNNVYANASLIVPKGAENGYKEATGWKNFVNLIIATDSIVLDQQTITINVYDEHQLHATVYPENATDTIVFWTSSDETVVKVSNSGRITGVSAGKATITAACGNVSASCEVEVVIVEPNEIILNKQAIMTTVNSVYQLHATVYPEDVTDKTVIWASSDESVAKVSDSGYVTGISVGKATITASCGNVSASCDVEVEVENFIKTQPTADNLLVELNTPEEGVKYQWYQLVEGMIYSKEIVPISSGEYAWTESNGVWTSGNNKEGPQTFSVMNASVKVQIGDTISFDYTVPKGDGRYDGGSQWFQFTLKGETNMQTFGGVNGYAGHYELDINDYIIDRKLNEDSTLTIGFECVRTNAERATVSNIRHTRPTGFYRGMVDEKIVGATTARLDDSLFVEGSVVYCVVTLPSGKTLKSDNVQTKNGDTGFKESVLDSSNGYTIYTLNGIFVMRTMSKSDLNNLPKGIYIVNGKILLVK